MVRETLGIRMSGNPVLTYTTNVIFRCPHLLALHDKGKAYRHIFIGPEGTWATIVAINGRDEWRFSIIGGAEQREYTTDEIKAAIRRAVGRDFDFEILSVLPWVRRELVAERYRHGRVFIAGDAAHVMSPTGGFGMNTGIGDAVDLSWKLAAMIDGWGGAGLLDSYELERQPVGARNVARGERQSAPHASRSAGMPISLDDTPQGARTREKSGANLPRRCAANGSRSASTSAIATRARRSAGRTEPERRPTTAEPMCRRRGPAIARRTPGSPTAARRSICSVAASRCSRSARMQPRPRPLDARREAARRADDASWPSPNRRLRALYERRLVLVRPDGHVAWRDDRMPDDPLQPHRHRARGGRGSRLARGESAGASERDFARL